MKTPFLDQKKITCSSSWIDAAKGRPSATRAIIVMYTILPDLFYWFRYSMYLCLGIIADQPEVEDRTNILISQKSEYSIQTN